MIRERHRQHLYLLNPYYFSGDQSSKETDVANETAKVVRFHTVGGPEVLKIQEEQIPGPGKGEVRLNVKAIGLNRAEGMFRKGEYLESGIRPSKLGYEAAG